MALKNVLCKTLPVQRSAGQSAVVGAAYRAGERLYDERQDRTVDYSRRAPDVSATLILLPSGAPSSYEDRATFWNAAEIAEKRKDGRPARDVQLGLAWELPVDLQREAVTEFARSEFVAKGHGVDIAFHRYGQRVNDLSDEGKATIRRWAALDIPFLEADECQHLNSPHVKIERRGDDVVAGYKIYQPHAHLYVTTRAIEPDGFAAKKNRILDRAETATEWRYEWPRLQNSYLEAIGSEVRVTATADVDPGEPGGRAPESLPNREYHMEARQVDTTAGLEAEFNRVQNDAVEASKANREQQADGSVNMTPDAERATIGAWWRNLRATYPELRERFKAHTVEAWERVRDLWHGARDGPERDNPPDIDREPDR